MVTLAKGTVRELLDERVSISEVTDMPGRNDSFSAMRILTLNFVASWFPPPEPEPPIAPEPAEVEELAISVTVPVNFRSLKASTSKRVF